MPRSNEWQLHRQQEIEIYDKIGIIKLKQKFAEGQKTVKIFQ